MRWLTRRGYVDERDYEDRSTERTERTALEACASLAMSGGSVARLEGEHDDKLLARALRPAASPYTAAIDGFNIHAGVSIDASDDEGRERLARYCLRPPFAVSRLSELPDGRIAYRTRYPLRGGGTHRIMAPLELMARLAAMVAPPRHPLVRYWGALSSHSSWRAEVVTRRARCQHRARARQRMYLIRHQRRAPRPHNGPQCRAPTRRCARGPDHPLRNCSAGSHDVCAYESM